MVKALFLSLPLHGHTNPTLPLVRELVARGDHVTYFSSSAFQGRVEQAGARYLPYRNAFLANITRLPERMQELPWLLTRATEDVLANELAAIRAERPDYIVTDSIAPWGHWVGQLLEVPVVTSVSTFAFNRRVMASALAQGARPKSLRLALSKMRHISKAIWLARRLRRQYGVPGPGITGLVFGRSDLNIVYTSRLFQPHADTFDDRFEFVGPSLTPLEGTEALEPCDVSQPPLVYVSLGTLFNADASFYRKCFTAFGPMNVRVIMSIGSNISEESLGAPPANFSIHAHVPQLEVLRRAAVFVSHGGMNSVSESLYCGVPLVVVPQMSEQALIGHRVGALGAGVYLPKAEVTASTLHDAVAHVLAVDGFRVQVGVIRDSFLSAGGVARAADAIADFTGAGDIVGA
ncbi:MAG: macrolide family glycosyltransferase [Vicinamibacterales bacterium]